MLALDLFENKTPLTLMDGFRKLLPIAVKHLNLPHLPKIHLKKEQAGTHIKPALADTTPRLMKSILQYQIDILLTSYAPWHMSLYTTNKN